MWWLSFDLLTAFLALIVAMAIFINLYHGSSK